MTIFRPTGGHSGNTVESWLTPLHMTGVFGSAYQICVCALGLVTAMLPATGVYIWWKKAQGPKARRIASPDRRSSGSELTVMKHFPVKAIFSALAAFTIMAGCGKQSGAPHYEFEPVPHPLIVPRGDRFLAECPSSGRLDFIAHYLCVGDPRK